jgi:putative transposase
MFTGMLAYKLADRGKQLVKVGRWYASTQTCSCCGSRHHMELSERVYRCEACGLVIDRDYNAAINIKNEGLRMLAGA